MRAGVSTIQQTLTPEAASVLNQSIAEAASRNHGQTTPLHVAATLLASPTGYLRQACIRSHPNSSHPLQCRALDLCFSVALERLPTTAQVASSPSPSSSSEPPISNALMAALKRAQAHQRRGCPEQQQQPLLAVKVELEQLIISILDDPSVSRVMREASFSSPAVKAAIEQSQNNNFPSSRPSPFPSPSSPAVGNGPTIGLGFRPGLTPTPGLCPTRSPMAGLGLYLNPRLQQHQQRAVSVQPGQSREEDVRKVIEILSRTRKKNPVLVGDSEPEAVVREVLRRIEKKELGVDAPLNNVEVVSVGEELGVGGRRTQVAAKLEEFVGLIERKKTVTGGRGNGLILDLGDLKWLVDMPPIRGATPPGHQQGVSEAARAAVAEMRKMLGRFGGEDGAGRLWLIGRATCETFLRCQVYHPMMEIEWDLQAVSIAARSPLPGRFPRLGTNGSILNGSLESPGPLEGSPSAGQPLTRSERSFPQNLDPSKRPSCCPQSMENYKREILNLSSEQSESSVSDGNMEATGHQLPQWLQNAKVSRQSQGNDQDSSLKRQSQELLKKWNDTCLRLHPSFHQNPSIERIKPTVPITGLYTNPLLVARQSLYRKPSIEPKHVGNNLCLDISSLSTQPVGGSGAPPGSPVRTDLVLSQTKTKEPNTVEKGHQERVKDFLGCISLETQSKANESLLSNKGIMGADTDSFKRLLRGLIEKVWWQTEAASAVAATVTQCKTGNRRRRAGGAKGDIWLLFSGPDQTGKKKLAEALSDLFCGIGPIVICLGSRRDLEESEISFRGKTVLDRIAEAIRSNPFSVIMLQDIDEADMLLRGSIKQAMERGRFADSYGREVTLGNIIFILTVSNDRRSLSSNVGDQLDEVKLASIASGGWQLRISVGDQRAGKRQPSWLIEDEVERASKQRRETGPPSCSFDLNELADPEEDKLDGSHNSSDLTAEHEDEKGLHESLYSPTVTISAGCRELRGLVDDAIVFKPVDFVAISQTTERMIKARIRTLIGEKMSVSIENEALKKILGGSWLGRMGLVAWMEKVLVPSICQLKSSIPTLGISASEESMVVRLEMDDKSESRSYGDWLPSSVSVGVVGEIERLEVR